MMASTVSPEEALLRLRIPIARVKDSKVELGRGSYGKVHEVEFDGKMCASKEVHRWMLELPADELRRVRNDFLRECHIWSMLRHPNVVQFLGIYYPSNNESGPPVMLMEKMQESLRSLVDKHKNIPLLVKVSILHDTTLGLRYLHSQDPPIVHRDLSPNNILVSPYLEAKITDLGVAKTIRMGNNSKTMSATPGTAMFMPPEALGDRPVYGPSLDVFSFGGVMLHITTHEWPNPASWSQIDPKTRKRINLTEVERRQQYIDMMSGGNAELKPLVVACLADDPELRPSAADISEKIKTLKELYISHDMMDPLSWLIEIRQASLPKQPQAQPALNGTGLPDLINKPATITWEEGAPAPILSGKFVAQAVSLNGVVYVGSGGSMDDSHFRIDAFHLDQNMWGDTIKTPVTAFALTALMDKLIVAGGETRNKKASNKVLILEGHELNNHSEMSEKRCDATATSYQSTMIIVGGLCGRPILSTEMYDSNTCQWYKCGDLPESLYSLQSVIVGDMLYVLGGIKGQDQQSRSVYATHLDKLSSHQIQWNGVADIPHGGVVAVGLFNKCVMVLGGKSRKDTVHVLKTEKEETGARTSWHLIGTLPSVHYWAAAASVDNKIIIVGGRGDDANMTHAVSIGTVQ